MSNSVTSPCAVCGQPTAAGVGVCHRTAECRRENRRRYHEANYEADLKNMRTYYANNADAQRQRRRDYVQAHYEEVAEAQRRRYWENPEQANEGRRQRLRAAGGDKRDHKRRAIIATLWTEQEGLCYLCEEPVPLEDAVLEHDHRCCPRRDPCSFCIRGASHQECNKAIGHAADDPEKLERLARNLRAKLAEIDERLASKPEKVPLF